MHESKWSFFLSLSIFSPFIFLHFFPLLFVLPSYSLTPHILIFYLHTSFSCFHCLISFLPYVGGHMTVLLQYLTQNTHSLSPYLPRSSFENDLTSSCHWKTCGYFCWSTKRSPTASSTSTSVFVGSALHIHTHIHRKKDILVEILLNNSNTK